MTGYRIALQVAVRATSQLPFKGGDREGGGPE